jgi:hypothetical protein
MKFYISSIAKGFIEPAIALLKTNIKRSTLFLPEALTLLNPFEIPMREKDFTLQHSGTMIDKRFVPMILSPQETSAKCSGRLGESIKIG